MVSVYQKGHIITNQNFSILPDNVRRSIRPLSELNLIDNFLFSTLMENPEIAEKLVKVILKRTLGHIPNGITIESQKSYNGINTNKHGIHIDVLVKESSNNGFVKAVYDIEPNAYREKSIAKRNRFYNALVDVKLLNSGNDYNQLPELINIWILPYDPFGKNKIIYTIKNIVDENPNIVYNDGIKTIILNASAAIDKDGELENLLKFMINSYIKEIDSELAEIQSTIHSIKGNPEVGEKYMSIQSAMYYEKKMSFEEGELQGFQKGVQSAEAHLAKHLLELGVDKELIEKAKTLSQPTKEQPVNN